ncbi:helix-turn-helix domain-containing protein [Haloarcula japonica]|uniref:Transcriptional regulator n=1 Tax=Haloarcula japonica (strain ATCC 49778 / DSM 6131 / JCM 7785 / NBRC 101032 / NCIMB 13157 / TR-1) TaxID=1227453 RepID=M0L742_HALJT|nr:helix-turn-helix domain-containing protein [Haloarcula japonica]EMA27780.1 putative transcriptional regulator [Haloarcula japonica DSM 6131]
MSITTKIHIEHERLALVPTLQNLEDIAIRVITQGNTDPGSTVFPFLIKYRDRDRLEEMLDVDPTVQSYELVDWTDQTGIYYIEHTPETKLISSVVTDVNGFLVHTETKGNGWLVRLLLPDREALNTIWEYANENDISLDIIEIYGNTDTGGESSYGLTDEQRTALTTAYENGYFGEPRDISLNEVAAEIGLSSTAMSGRLRRGMRNLIAATIIDREE